MIIIFGCVTFAFVLLSSKSKWEYRSMVNILPNVFANTDRKQNIAYIDSNDLLCTSLPPSLRWCRENPFLRKYDQHAIRDLELEWFKWSRNTRPRTYELLKTYAQHSGANTATFVNLAYPTSQPLPCPYRENLTRFGGIHDRSKILCGVESVAPSHPCFVCSLGSFGDIDFENALLENTCEIHTYDCTVPLPFNSRKRLTYHHICMGEALPLQMFIHPNAGKQGNDVFKNVSLFKRLNQIVQDNNHTHVDILKMDIEGGEYSVISYMLRHPTEVTLPYQISFESHWWNRDIYHAILHQQMFAQLWRNGYRFLNYELNPGDSTCVEWTLFRIFC
jgi:hypothetical protein